MSVEQRLINLENAIGNTVAPNDLPSSAAVPLNKESVFIDPSLNEFIKVSSDVVIKEYFESRNEAGTLPIDGKLLVQDGNSEPQKIDVSLFADADQGVLADTAIQKTELQLSQKFTSFGESYVNNFRSNMLDLGDEFFTSSAGYQIGKNKQLGLEPSLQMLPISGQAGKLRSIGSNRVNDFTVVRNSTATYIDEDGLIKTALENVPRFDYSEGLDPSLLLEPQSTNLFTYSDGNLSTYPTITNVTDAIAPINVFTNSIQFGDNSVGRNAYKRNFTSIVGEEYTISVFVQMDDNSAPILGVNTGTGDFIFVSSGSIVSINNKVERIASTNIYKVSSSRVATTTSSIFGVVKYTSQSAKGFKITGIQLEQSFFATSYIPTSGTTVTRLSDVVDNTGISDFIGQTEGTIFIKVKIDSEISNFSDIINFGRNTTNTINISRIHSIKKLRFSLYAGGSIVFNMDSSATTELGEELKLAITYKSGGSKMYLNGVQSNSLSSTFAFSALLNEININDSVLYFANQQVESVSLLEVYKTALTDAQLTELTTL